MILILILLSTVFATNAKYICTMDHYVKLEFNKVVFFESPDFPRTMTDDEIKQCFINFTEAIKTEKETKQFVIAISNPICFDDPTGINDYYDYCSSEYDVFTNKTSVFFDKNSFTYNYKAFQGYAYFNDGSDNYPLESVSRVQPFQLTDITEIIEIRSTYPYAKPRNQSCIWQFKAPEDCGFKIFITGLNLNSDTVFKVENSQEIIIEANGNDVTSYLEVSSLHYSADNFIKIYLSETNFNLPNDGHDYELSAYITIIKTLLNHIPINCSVTTNGSSVIWSYSNEFGIPNNAKCKYILKILPKTGKEILVKFNKMENEYFVDMIYYSYDDSISNGDDKIYFPYDYVFANDGKTEKELLFEFRSDGSIQSKAFEVEFVTKHCSCADSLIIVPCKDIIQTYLMKSEIDSTDRDFYCGNLECNFTIMLNSTCASPFIVFSVSFDSDPAKNDTFRVISNNKTICDPYYLLQNPCRIPSANHNIFQTITSSSLIDARHLTIDLSASNISTYLPTFVINETKPYYFHDPFFTNSGETPYMILIKLSPKLRQRNATIDVFLFNDDHDQYNIEYDLGFYQDARLTNQIDFRNCFTAVTDAVLKCKTNLDSVAFVLFDTITQSFLFQVTEGDNIIGTEGCVFNNNVFYLSKFQHKDEKIFSVMSNGKQKCRIFCYSSLPFIIQHIWISPNSNGTFSIFSGYREKLLVDIDARSTLLWHNFMTLENIYVMEIPLNSFAMLTGYAYVLFEDPINITNKPYKTVLTSPFYGSSNIISYQIYDDGCSGDPYRMFNILENTVQFTVLDTDFLLPNYFYFVLNKTTYINMTSTTNSILFGPFTTVGIGCSCSSNVNCNIRMLLETINFIEANTTTTLKPSTTTNALTTTTSLKANDKSFSFILTVNYFLLFMNGFI